MAGTQAAASAIPPANDTSAATRASVPPSGENTNPRVNTSDLGHREHRRQRAHDPGRRHAAVPVAWRSRPRARGATVTAA